MNSQSLRLILVILMNLPLTANASVNLSVQNANGWRYEPVEKDSIVARLLPDTYAVLVKGNQDNESTPTITVRKIAKSKSEKSKTEQWRKILFGASADKNVYLKEQILIVDGVPRYITEYQQDTGTETMLNLASMGIEVGGELFVLTFKHHPGSYKKEISGVRELFNKIKLTAKAQ